MVNMSEVIVGITLHKTCKVREDADSKTFKTVHLRIKYDGATVKDVFDKSTEPTVIQWQAKARKEFASIKDGSTVDVVFSAPTRTTIDPKTAYESYLMSLSTEEREKALEELKAKAATPQAIATAPKS
jgi:uncharacterized protein (UPF0303 family)